MDNRDAKDLSFTIFVTGIDVLIVALCFYLANDVPSGIIGAIIIFTIPLLFSYLMIEWYIKNENKILASQNFSKVVDK